MNIFTLRNAINGNAEVLNGKILAVKKADKNGDKFTLQFIDLNNKTAIWQTTTVINEEVKADGIVFTTRSGSIYDLLNVQTLIPTYIPTEKLSSVIDFKVVGHKTDRKNIHYGDGYTKNIYEFDREISEEEFVKFCKKEKLKVGPQEYPYQDYGKVYGSGKVWTHHFVHCYTD